MCLIEVAGLVDRIENGNALREKSRCVSGAFDLANRGTRDPGRAREVTLRPSCRKPIGLTSQRRVDRGVAYDNSLLDEPGHERIRVLEIGVLPRGAIQPEGAAGSTRQIHVVSILQLAGRERRHVATQLEANAQPLTVRRTVRLRRCRFRPANRQEDLAFVSSDGHFDMTVGDGYEHACSVASAAPDPFDTWRV